jgi:hypothetical protein
VRPALSSHHGCRPSPARSPRALHHPHYTHHSPALTYTLSVATVEARMAGFVAQRRHVPSGEPPLPPREPVADGNPAIGCGANPRAPYTHHPSPPRADAAGVTNSGELGPPFPVPASWRTPLSVAVSPSPSSLSLSCGTRHETTLPLPSAPVRLSLSLSHCHVGPWP